MITLTRTTLASITALSALGATGLWARVLAVQWPRLLYGESLCVGDQSALGHCLACYPAAALSGLTLAGLVLMRRSALRPAVSRSDR